MGLFDRFRKNLAAPGTNASTPSAIEGALDRQGMTTSAFLGPGRPLTPNRGYSVQPRAVDYPVGVNVNIDGRRAWGRTSWDFLREFTNSYDVARICINHKIDEIRSMDLLFQPATGVTEDVSEALRAARAVLAYPDREHPFDEWLSMWLENQLRYDAGVWYRRRNMDGEIIGLEIIDGTTIVPKIDSHGRRPQAPAPAYSQVIKGQDSVDFTAEDVSYLRFRPQADSPYGLAPIESILMTVNTDIRFQWHLLQMFTDGSVPHGFIELPPDISSPDQVAEWQDYWDAIVLGDQAKAHQLIAVPADTKVTETRPKAFDETFPDYLVVKVAAAFGVVPQDLGLLKDVNRANGETQMDVQFRVNTLPWVRFVQSNLNRYLQHDLGLPVKVALDTGRDKEDRLAEAQAWKLAVESGAVSMDEWRQEVYGLPVDNQRPVPRGIITPRTGFVPLTSVLGISGQIDADTKAPADDVPLPTTPFEGAGGVIPDKLPGNPQFKRAPIDPDEPSFPELEHVVPGSDIVNGMPSVGGTLSKSAADSELVKFRAFVKARAKQGKWRDFEFAHIESDIAERLNREARESGSFLLPGTVTKKSDVTVAGLAVQAATTGRVLMLQRALDPDDDAAGKWEFPGGHLEDGETPSDAAVREWQEEVGLTVPAGTVSEGWSNGHYQGFALTVPDEFDVSERDEVSNPDGDTFEAVAWWNTADLIGNPGVRAELASSMDDVLSALGKVVKGWRDTPEKTPQLRYDLKLTDHYAPVIENALSTLIRSVNVSAVKKAPADLLGLIGQDLSTEELDAAVRQIIADSYLAGVHAAGEQVGGGFDGPIGSLESSLSWDSWTPGNPSAALKVADGGLADLLDNAGVTVQGITGTVLDQVGNRIADGLDKGLTGDEIASSLEDIAGARSEIIAHTEVARAMTAASFDVYTFNGVAEWDLITSAGACAVCLDAEARNPHPVGDDSDASPLHPFCRCSTAPHVESMPGGSE